MAIEEFFEKILTNLNPSQSDIEKISHRHLELRKDLNESMSVEEDFLTGSYSRNTLIIVAKNEPFDVDFFLAFSDREYSDSELSGLIDEVRVALLGIMSDNPEIQEIILQNRSVGVIYGENFKIDVVPAIQIEKDLRYRIYDKLTSTPIESNPKIHSKLLTEANERTESGGKKRLVPIIKLLKLWKSKQCEDLKSFHLELLAIEILGSEEIASYSQGLKTFFDSLPSHIASSGLEDPANSKNVIDVYLDEDEKRGRITSSANDAIEIIKIAISREDDGDIDGAINEWEKLFSDSIDSPNTRTASRDPKIFPVAGGPKPYSDEPGDSTN